MCGVSALVLVSADAHACPDRRPVTGEGCCAPLPRLSWLTRSKELEVPLLQNASFEPGESLVEENPGRIERVPCKITNTHAASPSRSFLSLFFLKAPFLLSFLFFFLAPGFTFYPCAYFSKRADGGSGTLSLRPTGASIYNRAQRSKQEKG